MLASQGIWNASYGPHGDEVVWVTFRQEPHVPLRGLHAKLEGLKVINLHFGVSVIKQTNFCCSAECRQLQEYLSSYFRNCADHR